MEIMHITLEPIILYLHHKRKKLLMCSSASREPAICFLSSPHYWSALSLGKKEYSGRTTYWELKSVCWLKSVSPHLSKEVVFNGKKKEHWHNKRVFKYAPTHTTRMHIQGSIHITIQCWKSSVHILKTLKWAHAVLVEFVSWSECTLLSEKSLIDLSFSLLIVGQAP